MGLRQQCAVVELTLIGDHVRVRSGRRHQVVVSDKLADPGPGHPGQVEQGDAPVSEVVRREGRHAGGGCRCRESPISRRGAFSARWGGAGKGGEGCGAQDSTPVRTSYASEASCSPASFQRVEKGAYGIRTRAAAVRGRCPRPLDECALQKRQCSGHSLPLWCSNRPHQIRRFSRSRDAAGRAAPEGIVLRTDPECDVRPAASGGSGRPVAPGGFKQQQPPRPTCAGAAHITRPPIPTKRTLLTFAASSPRS